MHHCAFDSQLISCIGLRFPGRPSNHGIGYEGATMYSALIPHTFRLTLVHSRWGNPAHSLPIQLVWVIGKVRAAMHTMEFNSQCLLRRGPRRTSCCLIVSPLASIPSIAPFPSKTLCLEGLTVQQIWSSNCLAHQKVAYSCDNLHPLVIQETSWRPSTA